MERNVISGISRFGRLRKVSTKLIDLPNRSAYKTSKRKRGPPRSPSIQKHLPRKLSSKVMVDPFVDFTPDMFDGLLVSDKNEDTDTSSSVGESDDESVVMWKPSDRMVTKHKKKKCEKQNTTKKSRKLFGKPHDKRISRCSAYSLWSKDVRLEILATQPDLNIASVSRKLAEMWAELSPTIKYNLKRRAKLANSKIKKNFTPVCEMAAPIEAIWLPSNY